MKLNVAQNIRRCRRERGLSQEELGELLGVSPQSVSHWECGVAYPDLETVPVIAGFFGITTDELLGTSSSLAEERKEAYRLAIIDAYGDERISVIRDAWREFPCEWNFARELCSELEKTAGGGSEEILKIAYDVLDRCTDGWQRALFTEFIAKHEEDSEVYDFLDRVVTDRDIRSNKLLELRYKSRGELNFFDAISQFNTARDTETILFSDISPNDDPVRRIYANLEYLNMISGVDETTRHLHPVLGDGVVDMWVDVRAYNGFRLGCRLAGSGRFDEALTAFEETAEVIARFLQLPDGAILSYRTDLSGRLDVRISKDEHSYRHAEFINRVGLTKPGKPEKLPSWPPDFGLNLFADTGSDMYKLLGDIAVHPRYIACTEKIRELVNK